MGRQKSADTKNQKRKLEATKSLSARYAELLKLREAVSRSQFTLKLLAGTEQAAAKEDRALPYH